MGVGLLFTAVFVCLPMIVNYQNFRRPVGHQLGPARRPLRHRQDALRYRHEPQCPLSDSRNCGRRGRLRIDVTNPDGELRPVIYCTVELKIPR